MKKRVFNILIHMIGPAIFVLILWKFIDIDNSFKIFIVMNWGWFTLAMCLMIVSVFIRSVRWQLILRNYDIQYSVLKCFKLCFVAGAVTSFLSSAGGFVKVLYVNRSKEGISRPVASIFAEKYIDIAMPAGLAVVGFIMFFFKLEMKWLWAVLPLAAVLLYFLLLLGIKIFSFVAVKFLPGKYRNSEKLTDIISGFNKTLNYKTYLLSLAEFTTGGFIRIFILILALGLGLNLLESVMIVSFNSFVNFVPVSYLGIGIRDAGMIGAFRLLDLDSDSAVALSMTVLFSKLIFVFAGAVFWVFNPPPVKDPQPAEVSA